MTENVPPLSPGDPFEAMRWEDRLALLRKVSGVSLCLNDCPDRRYRGLQSVPARRAKLAARGSSSRTYSNAHDVAGSGVLPEFIELAGGPEHVVTITDFDGATGVLNASFLRHADLLAEAQQPGSGQIAGPSQSETLGCVGHQAEPIRRASPDATQRLRFDRAHTEPPFGAARATSAVILPSRQNEPTARGLIADIDDCE